MMVYLDASALVKRYVAETGSTDIERLIGEAQALGTVVISRAEVAAALGKAVRVGLLAREAARKALEAFGADWQHLIRLQIGEPLAARAASLAWEHGLRGYDAVHLASALSWEQSVRQPSNLARSPLNWGRDRTNSSSAGARGRAAAIAGRQRFQETRDKSRANALRPSTCQ